MATQPNTARVPVEWLLVRVAILGRNFWQLLLGNYGCDSVLHSAFSIAPSFSDFAITARLTPDFLSSESSEAPPACFSSTAAENTLFLAEERHPTTRRAADGEDVVLALVSAAHRADQLTLVSAAHRADQPQFDFVSFLVCSFLSVQPRFGFASAPLLALMSSWRVLGANSASSATQIDEVEATEISPTDRLLTSRLPLRSRQLGSPTDRLLTSRLPSTTTLPSQSKGHYERVNGTFWKKI